jgi:hypothetical protein
MQIAHPTHDDRARDVLHHTVFDRRVRRVDQTDARKGKVPIDDFNSVLDHEAGVPPRLRTHGM